LPLFYTALMNTNEAIVVSGYTKSHLCRLCETGCIQATKRKGEWEIDPVSLASYKPSPPAGNLPRPNGRLTPIDTIIVCESEAHAWALEGNIARFILILKLHKEITIRRSGLEVSVQGKATEEFVARLEKSSWKT